MMTIVDRVVEWGFRHKILGPAVAVTAVAVLMLALSRAGGDQPAAETANPGARPAVTATATAIPQTGPRVTYRTTRDPAFVAVAFVRAYLATGDSHSVWLSGVRQFANTELAAGLARTDRATIPNTSVRAGQEPDVDGGIEEGGATVAVDLTSGAVLIVTLQYIDEGDDGGQWLVSGIEPGSRA